MVYFDTNVLIYAFAQNIDDVKQRDISVKLIEEAIKNDTLLVSQLLLCEVAFILQKINEDKNSIDNNLEFLSTYLQPTHFSVNQRVLEILKDTSLYKSSFDIYHLAFSEYHNAKLITFDKGFKKLQNISNNEVIIK
jgi:predicted nucleic acid-binding protein